MEITAQQEVKVELYKKQYLQNVELYATYGAEQLCSFSVYASNNDNDKNITIVLSTISGISQDYEPITKINNIMVEPDGNSFNLTDIYDRFEVYRYIGNLKKIQ